jgi:hypothetical protein
MAKKATAPPAKRSRSMSDEHKAALAEGREQGRAVRRYLEALESYRPKRGRKRTPDSIRKRLADIEARLNANPDPLSRLHLSQERMDLQNQLSASNGGVDLAALEAEFIQVAAEYSRRKGITYSAWREAGVEPRVLKAAGIDRGM